MHPLYLQIPLKNEPGILVQHAYSSPERLNESLYYLFNQFCKRRGLILLPRDPEIVTEFAWSAVLIEDTDVPYFTLEGKFIGLDPLHFANGRNPKQPVVWSQIEWSKAYVIFNVEEESEYKDKKNKSLEERDLFFEFWRRK